MNDKVTTDPASNYGLDINHEGRRVPLLLMCGRTTSTESDDLPTYKRDWDRFTKKGDPILSRNPEVMYCNRPVASHPYLPNSTHYVRRCDRTDTTPESSDFYLTVGHRVTDYVDFSGNEAKVEMLINRTWSETEDGSVIDEHEYISPEAEWNALDRWSDKRPSSSNDSWFTTVTLEQHTARPDIKEAILTIAKGIPGIPNGPTYKPSYESFEPEVRNAYVEGDAAFTAKRFLNELLTRKHHARMLNVFFDKYNNLRVGSIKVLTTVDHLITAECVKCNKRSGTVDPNNTTRSEMEDFVLALIRHGNNHAHNFIRSRPDWYKVHSSTCSLDCNSSDASCAGGTTTSYSSEPELNEVQFLLDHQQYCNDVKCKCDERLKELCSVLV